jgi:hypothetical protein
MIIRVLPLLGILAATPAVAESPYFIEKDTFVAPTVIDLGVVAVTLEHTMLADIVAAMALTMSERLAPDVLWSEGAGDIVAQTEQGPTLSWACYVFGDLSLQPPADAPAPIRVTFVSEPRGDDPDGLVTRFAVERSGYASNEALRCASAPQAASRPDLGLPSVGDRLADLAAHFGGGAAVDQGGHMSYGGHGPAPSGGGEAWQELVYQIDQHGTIVGLGLEQNTQP